LCAQWKAADAAQLGAWLSGVSLIAVALALGLTVQSNRIARDTAARQLRAYISVEPVPWGVTDELKPLKLIAKNNGQTPAYLVNAFSSNFFSVDPREAKLPPKKRSPLRPWRDSDGYIAPGESVTLFGYEPPGLTPLQTTKIAKKEMALIQYGYIRYFDCFGKERTTDFAFLHWGDGTTGAWERCRWNNQAT
jgi:hypothetical protein